MVGIGSISQLFDAIPFITVTTSDSVIGVKLLSFDAPWCCCGENFSKTSRLSCICWLCDKKKSANSSANSLLDLHVGNGFFLTDDVNSDTNL